jgi:hypothetical protein
LGNVFTVFFKSQSFALDKTLNYKLFKRFNTIVRQFILLLDESHNEPGIQEMHDSVFDASDVNVDGHHCGDFIFCEDGLRVFAVHEAQEIPAGIDESVHGVGFALCLKRTTLRTGAFFERVFEERISIIVPLG